MRSTSFPSRRSSITGVRACHGSSRNSDPSVPIASSSSRSGSDVPQSKSPKTSFGNSMLPAKTQSVPVGPMCARPSTLAGSPASRRDPLTQ